jgi:hypothetical protein
MLTCHNGHTKVPGFLQVVVSACRLFGPGGFGVVGGWASRRDRACCRFLGPQLHFAEDFRRGHMKRWVDQILGLLAATATALLLGLIARNDMGLSQSAIRAGALGGVGVILAALSFATLLTPRKK